MAYKAQVILLALLVLVAIARQGHAGRQISRNSKIVDMKQPQFLKFDHSFLIPGIGRVLVPPVHSFPSYNPTVPSYIPVPGAGSYVPGGDDTFVPNPGFEVPNPGHSGSVPAPNHP